MTATEGPVLLEVLRSTLGVTAGLCPWTGREHEPRAAMTAAESPSTDGSANQVSAGAVSSAKLPAT